MKHDRLLALVTVLLLVWLPVANATSHIANFYQADGVEMCELGEVKDLQVPTGLEEMYALFAEGNRGATVYVFRMPNGRALLSVSCMEMGAVGDTAQLYEQRESLTAAFAKSMEGSLAGEPEFRLEERYGQQALVAEMTLNTNVGTLDARVTLFYRGEDLMEVWVAYPSASRYLFDQTAGEELESDLHYLSELEDSLDFSVPEENSIQPEVDDSLSSMLDMINGVDNQSISGKTEPSYMKITADNGTFSMNVPVDTVVVHPASDENTLARARALFADIKGGEECFDIWFKEIVEADGWLLISREYDIVAQVYVSEAGYFSGMNAETMLNMEQPILEMMLEDYDTAELADESSILPIDGMDHAWFSYDIRKGDMDLLSFVIAAADTDHLYEIDIYIRFDENTDSDLVTEAVTMMLETLDYLPAMDI